MWFRMNDEFDENAKVRKVRRSHPDKRRDASAVGVWAQAATWSARNQMDGFCPEEIVETFDDDWEKIAARLCEVTGPSGLGLFEPAVVNGEPGWIVHDFLRFNDSREEQERDRRAKNMRAELHRDPALISAIRKRDKDRCRYCGCQVNWRARRGDAAATYDHVQPISRGGTNTVENVVVACKGCNDRKGRRTLKEARMRLLDPGSVGAPVLDDDTDDDGGTRLYPVPNADQARTESVPSTRAGGEGATAGTGRVGSGAQNVPSTRAGAL